MKRDSHWEEAIKKLFAINPKFPKSSRHAKYPESLRFTGKLEYWALLKDYKDNNYDLSDDLYQRAQVFIKEHQLFTQLGLEEAAKMLYMAQEEQRQSRTQLIDLIFSKFREANELISSIEKFLRSYGNEKDSIYSQLQDLTQSQKQDSILLTYSRLGLTENVKNQGEKLLNIGKAVTYLNSEQNIQILARLDEKLSTIINEILPIKNHIEKVTQKELNIDSLEKDASSLLERTGNLSIDQNTTQVNKVKEVKSLLETYQNLLNKRSSKLYNQDITLEKRKIVGDLIDNIKCNVKTIESDIETIRSQLESALKTNEQFQNKRKSHFKRFWKPEGDLGKTLRNALKLLEAPKNPKKPSFGRKGIK